MPELSTAEISSRQVLSLPVYSCKEGLNLGNIRQILVDIKDCAVIGFLVERRRLSKDERIVPITAIHSFGKDGVTINSAAQLERRGNNSKYIRALRQLNPLIGARVFTTGGRTLGKVEEYRFDQESGEICGLEIAPDGFFKVSSLVKGEHILAISGRTIMLKNEAIEDASELENSFISNMEAAAETVREKASSFAISTADLSKKISDKASATWENLKRREDDYQQIEAELTAKEAPIPALEPAATEEAISPAATVVVYAEKVVAKETVLEEAPLEEAAAEETAATEPTKEASAAEQPAPEPDPAPKEPTPAATTDAAEQARQRSLRV